MWPVTLCLVTLLVIWIIKWIMRLQNPEGTTNIVLPPGSAGLPVIGETLNLVIPSNSLDLHPFIKTRLQRYGPIFRTNIIGRQVVVSADPEFNNYLVQQEGKLVELWYLDTFSKLFVRDPDDAGESQASIVGAVHKYLRKALLDHIGAESLKQNLLPQIEDCVNRCLSAWSNSQASIEVKHAISVMITDFSAKKLIGYDAGKSSEDLSEKYTTIVEGLMALPLNFPGTKYHKCRKDQKKVETMFRDMIKERRSSNNHNIQGDFLDQISNDMEKEKFLTEDFVVNLIFGIFLAIFESVSAIVALAFKFLSEKPSVLEELIAEQEAILKKRGNPNSSLSWEEYKSMTFTRQVINETLRLANVVPGLLRRALKDIPVKGFTIPAGWTIMLVSSAQQLSPEAFKDPLEFNPRRWKELDSQVVSKNFMPFGGGARQCAGAEYSRVFMATFFHVLFTKYRWTKTKGGEVARNPILGFGEGIHIKFCKK